MHDLYIIFDLHFVCLFFYSQTITPVCKTSEVAKLPSSVKVKMQSEVESLKEEKPPVICRVLKKSDKDSYHMYGYSTDI